jgi:membrane protein implicated in regulation of membrane protease activity
VAGSDSSASPVSGQLARGAAVRDLSGAWHRSWLAGTLAAREDEVVLLALAIVAALFWLPTGWGIAAVIGASIVEIGEAAFWVWLSRRRKPAIGVEALVGAEGVAVTECRPRGQVRVAGELWRANCTDGAGVGDEVVVERVEGDLTLIVSRK